MSCNCRGGNAAKRSFVHTDAKGKQTTYGSEVQARAAQIKSGGSWRVVTS